MKIRMLKTYKELVEGTEWTTFQAGKVYEVPDRIGNNFLGVKACVLFDEEKAADDDLINALIVDTMEEANYLERSAEAVTAEKEADRILDEEARRLEAEGRRFEAEAEEAADDYAAHVKTDNEDEDPEDTEERMDAPLENKAETPPENKDEDIPAHLVRTRGRPIGKGRGKGKRK